MQKANTTAAANAEQKKTKRVPNLKIGHAEKMMLNMADEQRLEMFSQLERFIEGTPIPDVVEDFNDLLSEWLTTEASDDYTTKGIKRRLESIHAVINFLVKMEHEHFKLQDYNAAAMISSLQAL